MGGIYADFWEVFNFGERKISSFQPNYPFKSNYVNNFWKINFCLTRDKKCDIIYLKEGNVHGKFLKVDNPFCRGDIYGARKEGGNEP